MSDTLTFRNKAQYTSYFTARNTTPGTGIAGHAAPTTADTGKPLVYIYNPSTSNRLYLQHIKIRVTAVGAGATTTDFAAFIDNSGAATRTGGGALITPVNNSGVLGSPTNTVGGTYANASPAVVYFGAVVTTAVATKQVASHRVRSVVPVVEDQYYFDFGFPTFGYDAALASTGTAVYQATIPMAPVVLGPLQAFYLVQWGASQSGAHSFDTVAAWIER